jgi:hypothetical protein
MDLKVFWFQNSEHVSGVCKQNDYDHEIFRHGVTFFDPCVQVMYAR